jgi:tetratricopeptide (TPR) repeat protein
MLLEVQNKIDEAIQHFQQASKTVFGKRNAAQLQAMACYHAARLLQQQGNLTQALAYIKRGLSLSQHHAPSFVLYGMLMNENPDIAKQAFLAAIAVSPSYAAAHFNMGVLEWTQGNRSEAESYWKTATSLDPSLQEQINRIQNP